MLKVLKNDRIKITVQRITGRNESVPALTLLTYREFACCALTDTVTVTANKATATYKGDPEDILFDDIAIDTENDGTSVIRFYLGHAEKAVIKAGGYTIGKP